LARSWIQNDSDRPKDLPVVLRQVERAVDRQR